MSIPFTDITHRGGRSRFNKDPWWKIKLIPSEMPFFHFSDMLFIKRDWSSMARIVAKIPSR